MKGALNEDGLRSELAGSGFFQRQQPKLQEPGQESHHAAAPSSKGDVMPPQAHATMPPRDPDSDLIESIRKTVRQLGKEEATYRLTPTEKKAIAEIVYAYGNAGIRTNNNEVTRIGLNYLLEDYRLKGGDSILARVLERLNE